jgi:TPR repeat protein
MYTLGVMFDEGLRVVTDEQRAFQWYSRAAAHGDAASMNRLGILYAEGRGVPRDCVAALAWYRQAAAKGSLTAISNACREACLSWAPRRLPSSPGISFRSHGPGVELPARTSLLCSTVARRRG